MLVFRVFPIVGGSRKIFHLVLRLKRCQKVIVASSSLCVVPCSSVDRRSLRYMDCTGSSPGMGRFSLGLNLRHLSNKTLNFDFHLKYYIQSEFSYRINFLTINTDKDILYSFYSIKHKIC